MHYIRPFFIISLISLGSSFGKTDVHSGMKITDGTVVAVDRSKWNGAWPNGIKRVDAAAFADPDDFATLDKILRDTPLKELTKKVMPAKFKNQTRDIRFPKSVKVIDNTAFFGTSIDRIEFFGTGIGAAAFYACIFLKDVRLHEGLLAMGERSFARSGVSAVTIPNSVRLIGKGAFQGCEALREMTLPSNLEEVSEECFDGCISLKEIVIPEGVTKIGKYAFRKCESLTRIVIPSSVQEIEEGAFEDCFSLKELVLPQNLAQLHPSLCKGCRSLTQFTFPTKIQEVPKFCFSGCSSLTHIDLPKGVNKIWDFAFSRTGVRSFSLSPSVWLAPGVFSNCEQLTEFILPEGIREIPSTTFANCFNLQNITLPKTITYIGEKAFYKCMKLDRLALPDAVVYVGPYAFEGLAIKSMKLPPHLLVLEDGTFNHCSSLSQIDWPKGLLFIGSNCFSNCESLTTLAIPSTVRNIGEDFITNRSTLTSLKLPSNLHNIHKEAFGNLKNIGDWKIRQVYFSNGSSQNFAAYVTNFQNKVPQKDTLPITKQLSLQEKGYTISDDGRNGAVIRFSKCQLTPGIVAQAVLKVSQGKNIKIFISNDCSIVPGTFRWFPGISWHAGNITITIDMTEIPEESFSDNPNITHVEFGGNTRRIADQAFFGCRNLQEVQWPTKFLLNKLKSIGSAAFSTTALGTVRIPNSVTEIGACAFAYNPSMSEINFPRQLKEIPDGVCAMNSRLYRVGWPSTLESIGHNAFDGTNLMGATFPAKLKKIGKGAFTRDGAVQVQTSPTFRLASDDIDLHSQAFPSNATVYMRGEKIDWPQLSKELLAVEILTGKGPSVVDIPGQYEDAIIEKETETKKAKTFRLKKMMVVPGASLLKHFFHLTDEVPLMSVILNEMEKNGQLTQFMVTEKTEEPATAVVSQRASNHSESPLKQEPFRPAQQPTKISATNVPVPTKTEHHPQITPDSSRPEVPVRSSIQSHNPSSAEKPAPKPVSMNQLNPPTPPKIRTVPTGLLAAPKILQQSDSVADPDLKQSSEKTQSPSLAPKESKTQQPQSWSQMLNNLKNLKEGITTLPNGTIRLVSNDEIITRGHFQKFFDKEGASKNVMIVLTGVKDIERLALAKASSGGYPQTIQLVIVSSLEYISDQALQNCRTLVNVILPETLNTIGNSVFKNCTSLSQITIPSSVEVLGSDVFAKCTKLKKIICSQKIRDSSEKTNATIELLNDNTYQPINIVANTDRTLLQNLQQSQETLQKQNLTANSHVASMSVR